MEKFKGLKTELGKIEGRDAIYLDKITFHNEHEMTLTGEFYLSNGNNRFCKQFEMKFKGIVFLSMIELDFESTGPGAGPESLGVIENSEKIKQFERMDHSSKLKSTHKHYHISTYDTVFEIISSEFQLVIKT